MEPKRDKNEPNDAARLGLAMTLPMMMVAGPLVGYALGLLARRAFGLGSWIEIAMTLAGLVAGFREAFLLMRRLR